MLDNNALINAIKQNRPIKEVKKLIESPRQTQENLTVSLAWAIRFGKTEIAEMLLLKGANILSTNKTGKSLLMLAAQLGHTEIVTLLMHTLNPELRIERGLEKEIALFFKRIESRMVEIQRSTEAPTLLRPFITRQDLLKTYQTVFTDPLYKNQIERSLKKGLPVRIAKEQSGLPYTLNVVFDSNTDSEVALILETKSKILSADKTQITINPDVKSFTGGFKKVKPAYRIDKAQPAKWANAVFYAKKKSYLEDVQAEEAISKHTAKGQRNTFIHRLSAGPVINKKGGYNITQAHYRKKQSFYSNWANCGELHQFLTDESQNLTSAQRNQLARQLLTAVYSLHKEGIIHQDIKDSNILVFKDDKNNIHLELADFGISYNPKSPKLNNEALATIMLESPEISVLHKDEKSYHHQYFYDESHYSLGREHAKNLVYDANYKAPHKSNDMWAVGVVLYFLYFDSWPTNDAISKLPNTPIADLIKALLNPDREARFTVEMALAHPSLQQPSISNSPDVQEACFKEKNKALMLAIEENHPETVEELICAGAYIGRQYLDKSLAEGKHPKIKQVIATQLFLAKWGTFELIKDQYYGNHAISFSQRNCIFSRRPPLSDFQKAQLEQLEKPIGMLPALPHQEAILNIFEAIGKAEKTLGQNHLFSDPKLNKLLIALQTDLKAIYEIDARKIRYHKSTACK